jgi:hypothetical protein
LKESHLETGLQIRLAGGKVFGGKADMKPVQNQRILWRLLMKSLNMIKWHKGPPPSIGWWPASHCKDENTLRWWNGKYWGLSVNSTYDIKDVIQFAKVKAPFQDGIEWTDRPSTWPERSRT